MGADLKGDAHALRMVCSGTLRAAHQIPSIPADLQAPPTHVAAAIQMPAWHATIADDNIADDSDWQRAACE